LLEPQDIFIIALRFFIAAVLLLFYYRIEILQSHFRYLVFILFAASLIWMGQTSEPWESDMDLKAETSDYNLKKFAKFIQANVVFGSPKGNDLHYQGSGCDKQLVENHEYVGRFSGGIWYEQAVKKNEKRNAVFGIGSNYNEYGSMDILQPSAPKIVRRNFSIGTYFGGDEEKFGYKFGAYFGDIQWINPINSELQKSVFFPMVQVRLGSLHKVYGKFGAGDDFAQGVYGTFDRYLLGINMKSTNLKNDQLLELGLVNLVRGTKLAFYAGGQFSMDQNWMFMPSVQLGDVPYFGLGVGIRFDE
jgi:hypothetical protein